MLHARIVGNDDTAARIVTKETHDGGVGAANNLDDTSFGAMGAGQTAEAGNFGDYGIAVHGVFDVVAWDEDVAVEVGQGHIRDHEAVAILVQDQAALDFVARRGFVLREFIDDFGGGGSP